MSSPDDHEKAAPVAAIDCGTNSIRLLIARAGNQHLGEPAVVDLVRQMKVVRLGAGVDVTGELSDEALQRTFNATKEYKKLIDQHQVSQIRFVATSATRDARNRSTFSKGIHEILGVEPVVVSGEQEAQLSFSGAISALEAGHEEPILVVDIGGGSTEFVLGSHAGGVEQSISVDMGAVRFTERYLRCDPPTEEEIRTAEHQVDLVLSDVPVDFDRVRTIVGVAGSITTVSANALNLQSYLPEAINGAQLSITAVKESAWSLLRMDRGTRAKLPFMHPGRIDVIGAGALIWARTLSTVRTQSDEKVQSVITSEHDILDGIALSMLQHG